MHHRLSGRTLCQDSSVRHRLRHPLPRHLHLLRWNPRRRHHVGHRSSGVSYAVCARSVTIHFAGSLKLFRVLIDRRYNSMAIITVQ